MDPQTRGMVITSADWLREAHNSLSPPSAISLDGLGLPKAAEDAYHFVVYLPVMGSLYELDGLKQHPVRHGTYEEIGEGWVKKARSVFDRSVYQNSYSQAHREVIETRIATYPVGAVCCKNPLNLGSYFLTLPLCSLHVA
jgi:ubiquitin carboxyl-terminal hydrolase L5